MKSLILSLFFVGLGYAQVVRVAAVPPQPAKPEQAILTSGSVVMTITGDAVPAVKVTIVIKEAGVQTYSKTENISNYNGEVNTYSIHSQTVTWVINGTTGAWTGTAVVNGAVQTGSGNF